MNGEHLAFFWKRFKIGFIRRLVIAFILILSITLFNSFYEPMVKLVSSLVILVAAELFIYSYYPYYYNALKMTYRTKSIELPFPNEIASLAKNMGLNITKMKVIPKVFNAFARGNQLFIGEDLLKKLDINQIKAVCAHEFGHIKEKHIIIQIFYVIPIALFVFSNWIDLPAIMADLGIFAYLMILLVPLMWWFEKRADFIAVKYVGKEAMRSALLSLENKATMNEASETHPSTMKRLQWIDAIDSNTLAS